MYLPLFFNLTLFPMYNVIVITYVYTQKSIQFIYIFYKKSGELKKEFE